MKQTPLKRAIKLVGRAALAERLGITPQAVSLWGEEPPPGRVLEIEAATGGKVSRYQLRPDIYGPAP